MAGVDQIPRLYWYKVKEIVSVWDGDTLTAELNVGFFMTSRIKLRVAGLDTPELGEAGALEARDYVRKRLAEAEPGTITVRTFKTEKWGRWLATVFIGDENLNETLIKLGYAKPYDGGAR